VVKLGNDASEPVPGAPDQKRITETA